MGKKRRKKGQQRKKIQQRKKRQNFIWLIGLGLLLAATVVFILVRNANQINPEMIAVHGRPAVKVDREVIDYGDVKLNTNLTFDIKVTNVGDQTLRFSRAPYVAVLKGC